MIFCDIATFWNTASSLGVVRDAFGFGWSGSFFSFPVKPWAFRACALVWTVGVWRFLWCQEVSFAFLTATLDILLRFRIEIIQGKIQRGIKILNNPGHLLVLKINNGVTPLHDMIQLIFTDLFSNFNYEVLLKKEFLELWKMEWKIKLIIDKIKIYLINKKKIELNGGKARNAYICMLTMLYIAKNHF